MKLDIFKILGIFWKCFCKVLECFGSVLEVFGKCLGNVLEMFGLARELLHNLILITTLNRFLIHFQFHQDLGNCLRI